MTRVMLGLRGTSTWLSRYGGVVHILSSFSVQKANSKMLYVTYVCDLDIIVGFATNVTGPFLLVGHSWNSFCTPVKSSIFGTQHHYLHSFVNLYMLFIVITKC